MNWLRGVADRLVLLACVLVGGAVPGYLLQYRQHIAGRMAQARADLQPFVELAVRYHEGSLEKLIAHHKNSSDPTFQAEGEAIRAIADSVNLYSADLAALGGNAFADLWYLSGRADQDALAKTWDQFEPAFVYTPDGLLVAAIVGALVWGLFRGCWGMSRRIVRRSRGTAEIGEHEQ